MLLEITQQIIEILNKATTTIDSANLDDTESIKLSLQSDVGEDDSAADESATLLLEAGKSFIMGSPNDGIGISDTNANLVTDLVDLESLVIFTTGSTVDIEIFVASA